MPGTRPHVRAPVEARVGAMIGAVASELEAAVLDDVRQRLDEWRVQLAGRPEVERERLLLLSLEREQIVAVAYREEAVAARVAELAGRTTSSEPSCARRWCGSGRTSSSTPSTCGANCSGAGAGRRRSSSTAASCRARCRGGRRPRPTTATPAAPRSGRVPPVRWSRWPVRRAASRRCSGGSCATRRFRRYCELNVALELSAELAYERLVELARDDQERKVFDRIRDDEARHAAAFRVLGRGADRRRSSR